MQTFTYKIKSHRFQERNRSNEPKRSPPLSQIILSDSNDKESLIQKFTCPICLNIIINPVLTECKHQFCFACLKEMMELTVNEASKCPMCRKDFPLNFTMKINRQIEETIRKQLPQEYENRLKSLIEQNKISEKSVKLKILYGNLHEIKKDAKPLRTNPELKNEHKWTIFVKILNEQEKNFIQKVEFEMHPSFSECKVLAKSSPFQISRVGWGMFEIPIKIFFHKNLKIPTLELCHMLSFQDKGKSRIAVLKIDKDVYSVATKKSPSSK